MIHQTGKTNKHQAHNGSNCHNFAIPFGKHTHKHTHARTHTKIHARMHIGHTHKKYVNDVTPTYKILLLYTMR